jgi:hypothetical protein
MLRVQQKNHKPVIADDSGLRYRKSVVSLAVGTTLACLHSINKMEQLRRSDKALAKLITQLLDDVAS